MSAYYNQARNGQNQHPTVSTRGGVAGVEELKTSKHDKNGGAASPSSLLPRVSFAVSCGARAGSWLSAGSAALAYHKAGDGMALMRKAAFSPSRQESRGYIEGDKSARTVPCDMVAPIILPPTSFVLVHPISRAFAFAVAMKAARATTCIHVMVRIGAGDVIQIHCVLASLVRTVDPAGILGIGLCPLSKEK